MQARLINLVTEEEVATTDEFVLRSGTATSGVWASAEPFVLDELRSYRVQVQVTDTGGNTVQRNNAGWLTYLVRTSFEEVALDRTTVTFEQREVTVSGVLIGVWPGTGEIRPLAGQSVAVNSSWDHDPVTTDADGRFSGTVSITVEHELVWARFASDSDTLPTDMDPVQIAIEPRQTRISIWATPHRVDRFDTTTLHGRVSWKTPDGWEPVPDAQIGVLSCTEDGRCSTDLDRPPIHTDADGRYRLVDEPFETGYYQAVYQADDPVTSQPDPFVAHAEATAEIAVLQPASLSDFTAVRDDRGLVVVEGDMQFGNFTPITIPVEIQFSRSGRYGWQTVAVVNAEPDGMFSAELDCSASGYWRARFPGVKNHFQTATSSKVFIS